MTNKLKVPEKKTPSKKATTSKKTVTSKKEPTAATSKTDKDAIKLLQDYIQKLLEDSKGIDILNIDLNGKTAIADSMFIVTGTSTRHVSSMAENLQEKLKETFGISCLLEGLGTADWVIVDAFDIIVHIFRPEIREIYNLEKLWGSDFSTANYTLYKR